MAVQPPSIFSQKGNPMKKLVSFMLVLLLLPLAGCGAMAEDVSIMATFYPVYILAENRHGMYETDYASVPAAVEAPGASAD